MRAARTRVSLKSTLSNSVAQRQRVIAACRMFSAWPTSATHRLAQSSRVRSVTRGAAVIAEGRIVDALTLVCEGSVEASETGPDGRRVTFKVARDGVYGLLPLLDGREVPSGLTAIEPATVLEIPYSAIRAELAVQPGLWESIAIEAGLRARGYTIQLKRFMFDAPRVRAAAVLLGLAATSGEPTATGIRIALPLSQERFAEMLGVSRQWVSTFVREMARGAVVRWRYGRVKLIDLPGLQAIARQGIDR